MAPADFGLGPKKRWPGPKLTSTERQPKINSLLHQRRWIYTINCTLVLDGYGYDQKIMLEL